MKAKSLAESKDLAKPGRQKFTTKELVENSKKQTQPSSFGTGIATFIRANGVLS